MADQVSMKLLAGPWIDWKKQNAKDMDRATMWALREVARRVKREAKKRAPVYKGDDPRIEPGLLKKSIGSEKRFRKPAPGTFAMRVGPRGPRVRFYASKVEAQAHYMADAHDATVPEIAALHAKAWANAMRGR